MVIISSQAIEPVDVEKGTPSRVPFLFKIQVPAPFLGGSTPGSDQIKILK